MTSLWDTLPVLSAMVPGVPDQLTSVLTRGAALEKSARELIEDVQDMKGSAGELFDKVEEALRGLRESAAEQRAAVAAAVGESEAAMDGARQDSRSAAEEVGKAVDAVGTASRDLRGEIDATAS
jgi:uncharacterized protein YoxC